MGPGHSSEGIALVRLLFNGICGGFVLIIRSVFSGGAVITSGHCDGVQGYLVLQNLSEEAVLIMLASALIERFPARQGRSEDVGEQLHIIVDPVVDSRSTAVMCMQK